MKILFVFGIPDDQIGHITLEQINAGVSLPGNTSIMQAVIEPLIGRGWQAQFAYLGQPTELDIDGVGAIINCICDASIHRRSLVMLQELLDKTGLQVINSPESIAACTREKLVSGKHSGVTIPLTTSYHSSHYDLETHLIKQGHKLPVLVRPVGMHSGMGMQRIEAVSDYVPDKTQNKYFITDFVDFISPDGLYRKYRLVYVAGQFFPHHLFIGNGWSLHFKDVINFMEENPALMEEANRYIKETSDEVTSSLKTTFENMGLDYGMVDYTLDNEGQAIIFEINPCFVLSGVHQDTVDSIRGGAKDPSPAIAEAILAEIDKNRH